jgi:hypothetical protein
MGKRRLGDLAREIRLFATPIPEARPESVHCRVMNAHAAQRLYHRHVKERLGKALTGKDKGAGSDELSLNLGGRGQAAAA